MSDEAERDGIRCPIGQFADQEREVERLTSALNAARTAALKAERARELVELLQILLACEGYDPNDTNCRLCHQFADLRLSTARLVQQAALLGERLHGSRSRRSQ
jgi:hypothetical protein